MLFTDRILFIHVPKTAGMSVTQFLIDNAPGATLSVPKGHAPAQLDVREIEGLRHERLHEASAILATSGRKLSDFEIILAVIRNPYDLEVSFYYQKRKSQPWIRGRAKELAMGSFLEFARHAPLGKRPPTRIEDYYELDGAAPANLRILRYENLERELYDAVRPILPITHSLGRYNAEPHPPYRDFHTPDVEEAIYRKYRWAFDSGYYAREFVGVP